MWILMIVVASLLFFWFLFVRRELLQKFEHFL